MIRGVLGSWKERDPPPGGRGGSERERERERKRGGFFVKAGGGREIVLGRRKGERERERWQHLLVCRLVVVQYQGQGKVMDEYRSWSVRASVARESLWGHWRRELNNGYYLAQ